VPSCSRLSGKGYVVQRLGAIVSIDQLSF
jgi:hypothetical protein